MFTDPVGEPRPFVPPCFTSGGTSYANAEEATKTWITLFDDAHRGVLRRYEEGRPMEASMVMSADFTLCGTQMAIMDSGTSHGFTFMPGISMIALYRDQEEVGRYQVGLSAVPEAGRCG